MVGGWCLRLAELPVGLLPVGAGPPVAASGGGAPAGVVVVRVVFGGELPPVFVGHGGGVPAGGVW